jgi:hypothetical protein
MSTFDQLEGSESTGLMKKMEIARCLEQMVQNIEDPETRKRTETAVNLIMSNLLKYMEIGALSQQHQTGMVQFLEHLGGVTGLWADKIRATLAEELNEGNKTAIVYDEETKSISAVSKKQIAKAISSDGGNLTEKSK